MEASWPLGTPSLPPPFRCLSPASPFPLSSTTPPACQELLSRISSLPGGAQLVDTRPFVLPVRYYSDECGRGRREGGEGGAQQGRHASFRAPRQAR